MRLFKSDPIPPHEPYGYAAGENYFPEGISDPGWYKPVKRGLEAKIVEKLEFLRKLRIAEA
jgi:putative ATPase